MNVEMLTYLQAILAHWDLPPVLTIAAFEEGRPIFKVTTAGAAFVLKDISDAPDLTRLEFTRDVLAHLARAGVRVPTPLPARSGQLAVPAGERVYQLTEFIETGGDAIDHAQRAELLSNTGQAIARLHQALASYPDKAAAEKTWHEDLSGQVGRWISDLSAGLPEAQGAVVRRVGLERGAAIADALRGLPEQLIHRDCHPGNILTQGTRVTGFIDCDHICIGPRVFDLSYYAVHHVKWVVDDAAATGRWLADLPRLLAGYRSVQSLTQGELAAFPYGMMAYHLLLSHWFMGLPQLEPIAIDIRSLAWLHANFDAVVQAAAAS